MSLLLDDFLNKKQIKYQKLQQKKKDIDDIDLELFASNIQKSFGNITRWLKGTLLIVLAIIGFTLGIILLISPKLVYKSDYSWMDEPQNYSENKINEYSEVITLKDDEKKKLKKHIKESKYREDVFKIRIISILFILLAILLYYKRRHLRLIRKKTSLIIKANKLSQNILTDYLEYIKEEKKELDELENIAKDMNETKT